MALVADSGAALDTLHFELTPVPRATSTGLGQQYFDFVVSGIPLHQRLTLGDMPLIGSYYPPDNASAGKGLPVRPLLGPDADLTATGRTRFYVCAECGDIECGAVTARIEVLDEVVIWRDFGWDVGDGEPDLREDTHVGPFVFDKAAYLRAFANSAST